CPFQVKLKGTIQYCPHDIDLSLPEPDELDISMMLDAFNDDLGLAMVPQEGSGAVYFLDASVDRVLPYLVALLRLYSPPRSPIYSLDEYGPPSRSVLSSCVYRTNLTPIVFTGLH